MNSKEKKSTIRKRKLIDEEDENTSPNMFDQFKFTKNSARDSVSKISKGKSDMMIEPSQSQNIQSLLSQVSDPANADFCSEFNPIFKKNKLDTHSKSSFETPIKVLDFKKTSLEDKIERSILNHESNPQTQWPILDSQFSQKRESEFQTPKLTMTKSTSKKQKDILKGLPEFDFGAEYDPDMLPEADDNVCLPEWAQHPFIKDKFGKFPTQEGYDHTTLHIPENGLKNMGKVMTQYWETKAENFDKLIFIKLWKMYYVYHHDAQIVSKICDSKLYAWKNVTQMYFHQSRLQEIIEKLIDHNQKIILMEPVENKEPGESVKREICQIITRGTFIEPNLDDYNSRYILFLLEVYRCFGFVYLDTTTHEFYFGEFFDTPDRIELKSLLLKVRPVEIVYKRSFISSESLKLIKNLNWNPQLTQFPRDSIPDIEESVWKVKRGFANRPFEQDEGKLPTIIHDMREAYDEYYSEAKKNDTYTERNAPFYSSFQAIYFSLEYLQYLLLADTVFALGNFYPHDIAKQKDEQMYLDSAAIQNLELLECTYLNGTKNDSMLGYMDKTKTPFGKRMFKRWLLNPLSDAKKIRERFEAVYDLMQNWEVVQTFEEYVAKIPDIERMINHVYNFSSKRELNSYILEDQAKSKIKYFLNLLNVMDEVDKLITVLNDFVPYLKSHRLRSLLSFKSTERLSSGKKTNQKSEGIFPFVAEVIAELRSLADIKDGLPVPVHGTNLEYDTLVEKIENMKARLERQLDEAKIVLECEEAKYVHSRHKFEIEVPEDYAPHDKTKYFVTSKRKGFVRLHSTGIENLSKQLSEFESEMKKVLVPFIVSYYKKFYEKNDFWIQVVSCISELDCLCSLAKVGSKMPIKCIPVFEDPEEFDGEPIFELKGMVHPLLGASKDIVPNDVIVDQDRNVFLISGPNMGGKSTLLRGICICTIMAQMGCFAPAQSFKLTPKDRIFTRIGSYDSLEHNKSTFYVELEETLTIVKEATKNSLLVIDELGRGTSTYDGLALAYSVLKYVTDKVRAMTFFATHYHLLLEEFRLYDRIVNYHMECQIENDEIVKFLYKFSRGEINKSFGIYAAKMADIPVPILERAKKLSNVLTKEKQNLNQEFKLVKNFNLAIKTLSLFEDNDGLLSFTMLDLSRAVGVDLNDKKKW